MTTRNLVHLVLVVVAAIGAAATHAEPAPSIQLLPVLSGLSSPILVTNAGDGSRRLFGVEQGGLIKVLKPGHTTPTVFLDIMSKLRAGGEQGLLGLAFHPQFASNGRFFVHYSRQSDGNGVIAEYRLSPTDPDVADPSTETVLLVVPQPFGNHNGGMIAFGPDGFLYIGKGDGGSGNDPGNRAQDLTQLNGKILRIDVDTPNGTQPYSSPPTNPFVGAIAGADEIFAYGLRNPWRFSFDRGTGDLYVGDVGQSAVEEIDIVVNGGNYGWRVWEGSSCTGLGPAACNPATVVFPIAEYGHSAGRCAVTGGYVYRGAMSSLPAGSYVYADYCTGEIFVLQNGTSTLGLDTAFNISSFGEDESGELYVVNIGGAIYRIIGLATAPTVTSIGPNQGAAGATVPVTVNGTQFAVGAALSVGAGITVTNVIVVSDTRLTATLTIGGGATVGVRTVTVTNPGGASGTLAGGFAVVGNALRITALTANKSAPQAPGTAITFTATATGGTAPYQYKWWVYNGTWQIAQTWSASNTFAWTPGTANSGYLVGVWVKSAGNPADTLEATASLAFPIQ
jgi:glucose/arabinose dehydrogenase